MADTKDRPVEIRALGGARALPPLIIVMFHYSEGHHYSGLAWLDLVVSHGYLWVEFFFALSGFVLTHAYGARIAALFTAKGYGEFVRSRLARLYPVHLFMLFALLALVICVRGFAEWGSYRSIYDATFYRPDMQPRGFIMSLLLIHAWNTMERLTWNGASWFVSVEFALCLMFPVFAWLASPLRKQMWRGLALLAAGVAGILYLNMTGKYGMDYTFHNGVLRGMADFSAGVGLAVLYGVWKPRDRLPDWAHSAIQLAVVAALFWAFYHAGWARNKRDYWVVMPMLALILALSFDRGAVARVLQTRPLQLLGTWSYAVYIGQTFWLQMMRVIEQRFYPPVDSIVLGTRFSSLLWWAEPALLVLVCIAWGGLLATFIEHPGANLIKRAFRRPA